MFDQDSFKASIDSFFVEDISQLQGVWKRLGRCIGSDDLSEVSEVIWIQIGENFTDFRSPYENTSTPNLLHQIDRLQVFSGTLTVAKGKATFTHDFHLPRDKCIDPDRSTLILLGEFLIELGDDFMEIWQRINKAQSLQDSTHADQLLTPKHEQQHLNHNVAGPTFQVAQVKDLAIGVWQLPTPGGVLLKRSGGTWAVRARIGDERDALLCLETLVRLSK